MMRLYAAVMTFALVGLGDAFYLTVEHLNGHSVRCTVTGGCSAVLGSAYAKIAGIPTAALGVAAYFTVFSCATLALFGYAWARVGLAVVVAPMFVMTCWLVYLQAFVLHAFCQYCLLSAALTLVLSALTLMAWQAAPSKSGS